MRHWLHVQTLLFQNIPNTHCIRKIWCSAMDSMWEVLVKHQSLTDRHFHLELCVTASDNGRCKWSLSALSEVHKLTLVKIPTASWIMAITPVGDMMSQSGFGFVAGGLTEAPSSSMSCMCSSEALFCMCNVVANLCNNVVHIPFSMYTLAMGNLSLCNVTITYHNRQIDNTRRYEIWAYMCSAPHGLVHTCTLVISNILILLTLKLGCIHAFVTNNGTSTECVVETAAKRFNNYAHWRRRKSFKIETLLAQKIKHSPKKAIGHYKATHCDLPNPVS